MILLAPLETDAILLDFSKAFDKVDHEGLLLKLEHLGISGPLLMWIRSFLVGREQRVVVDGMESVPSKVLFGVPQGTVLGPLFSSFTSMTSARDYLREPKLGFLLMTPSFIEL